jgi:hypothetical protein
MATSTISADQRFTPPKPSAQPQQSHASAQSRLVSLSSVPESPSALVIPCFKLPDLGSDRDTPSTPPTPPKCASMINRSDSTSFSNLSSTGSGSFSLPPTSSSELPTSTSEIEAAEQTLPSTLPQTQPPSRIIPSFKPTQGQTQPKSTRTVSFSLPNSNPNAALNQEKQEKQETQNHQNPQNPQNPEVTNRTKSYISVKGETLGDRFRFKPDIKAGTSSNTSGSTPNGAKASTSTSAGNDDSKPLARSSLLRKFFKPSTQKA